jgi:hypothetical protein
VSDSLTDEVKDLIVSKDGGSSLQIARLSLSIPQWHKFLSIPLFKFQSRGHLFLSIHLNSPAIQYHNFAYTMTLFCVRRRAVESGSVEKVLVFKSNNTVFSRGWIPMSITVQISNKSNHFYLNQIHD